MSRLPILKTYKLFIGGAFPRTESGRASTVYSPNGKQILAHICRASKKDIRDSVVAAKKAQADWAKRAAANRGQILYRIAEMLESRISEFSQEISRSTQTSPIAAKKEVQFSIDRLIGYVGWADKLHVLFGSVNPVSSSHFNFSFPEPTGMVGIIAPDQPSLLGFVSLLAPAIVSGNTAIIIASEKHPVPALILAEVLATSDVPAGVVNILSGFRGELVPHLASHAELNALIDASGDAVLSRDLQKRASETIKRVAVRHLKPQEWLTAKAENPYWMLDTLEIKTTWHPQGL
jgi:acyl-CoA reductase-like NAD-dependent aldehyde dehydrogenase